MSLSMYQASVPVIVRALENLSAVLKKAEEFANSNDIPAEQLTEAKLIDDMFPLVRQIQIASDGAKGAGARLAGVEIPSFADTEKTFAEMQERIGKTIAFLKTIKPAQIDGSEDKKIVVQMKSGDLTFTGQDYLLNFAIPNVFFHVTTAYGILRHKGVPIGKKDYLGALA